AALAAAKGASGVEGLADRRLGLAAQEQLWALDMAAVAAVRAHGVFSGFLAVGRKRSGLAYAFEELAFLDAVASEAAAIVESGPVDSTHLGRYRIERRIGTGGMAEVLLAWQLGPGGFERRVALKRPLPHLAGDPDCLAMLFDEARIAAQLQHRNVVQIYEIDQQDGAYYIAMEHVDGASLRRLLRSAHARLEAVPLGVAVAIVLAVLDGLDHAHGQTDAAGQPLGVVHRDVTPGNVLLSKRGEVKLTDFGIARARSRLQATRDGAAKGTLPYMSPEQARSEPLDHRSDLFSLGVVLFEMIGGKRPFPMGPVAPEEPLARQLPTSVPEGVRRVLVGALEFDPDRRFRSAGEMRRALADALPDDELATEQELAEWVSSLRRQTA
ncbi:MAG: serine/threonine protein kinase, partial [Deltaproteobacteria bacterium]|nr:serine/threonine protein kinase [Deltaproteobacteria bacterium]MBW2535669.1 serine/threonine protein kinase [Deltaproteobacteria bacterium]